MSRTMREIGWRATTSLMEEIKHMVKMKGFS